MKNKIALACAAFLGMVSISRANSPVYPQIYVATQTVTYNQNFVIKTNSVPNPNGIDRLSAQVNISSANPAAQTFTDGSASSGNINVASLSGLTTAYATDQITVAATSVIQDSAASNSLTVVSTNGLSNFATDAIVVQSTTGLTGTATDTIIVNSTNNLSGAVVNFNGQVFVNNGWRVDVTSDTAYDITTQWNSLFSTALASATVSGSTVTLTAASTGTYANSWTLAVSPGSGLAVGSNLFSGGFIAIIYVNGVPVINNGWTATSTATVATAIGTQIGAAFTTLTATATVNSSTCTLTAATAGSAANSFTLSTNLPSALVVRSSLFTGGNLATITINGAPIINNGWRIDVTSDTAADVLTQIKSVGLGVTASQSGSTVNLKVNVKGVVGNSYTLASSTAAITVSSAVFTGGQNASLANQYFTFNGTNYYWHKDWNNPWIGADESTATCTSIAGLMNTFGTIVATCPFNSSTIFATATVVGSGANAFTLTSSTPTVLTVSSPTFSGGQNNATIQIGPYTLIAGYTQSGSTFLVGATKNATALNISSSIANTAGLSSIVVSTVPGSGSVLYATSTAVGTAANYAFVSSSPTALAMSGPTMTGGINSATMLNSGTIVLVSSNPFSTGMGVVFSTGTGVGLSPLVWGTTYYVVDQSSVNGNIALSSTSALAQAGQFLIITSSSATGPHNFTLTPSTITGSVGLTWEGSNDCVNYSTFSVSGVAVSSVTFATPFTTASYLWDFGSIDYACIEAAVTGPTTGSASLQIIANGKN